jgi:hypothetical protein
VARSQPSTLNERSFPHKLDRPSPRSTHTTPTEFFDLPREIRVEIYDHLWTSMPLILLPHLPQLWVKARHNGASDDNTDFPSLPAGLAGYKLLLVEGL